MKPKLTLIRGGRYHEWSPEGSLYDALRRAEHLAATQKFRQEVEKRRQDHNPELKDGSHRG